MYIIDYQYFIFEVNFPSLRDWQEIARSVKFSIWAKISFCQIEIVVFLLIMGSNLVAVKVGIENYKNLDITMMCSIYLLLFSYWMEGHK